MTRVLVAGESWSVTSIHTKGFDSFTTVDYQEGGAALLGALKAGGFDVTYMPCHVAATDFPWTVEELDEYDVVLLSDVGANTFLLPAQTFVAGQQTGNRLRVLRDWVRAGGGFGMVGGYMSFQGIEAKANYRSTPLADILPVELEIGDDREESPEGVRAHLIGQHPITEGIDAEFPPLLGYQRFESSPSASVLAAFSDEAPLLVVNHEGAGRTLAYASDIGPHWAPTEFTDWAGFSRLWQQAVAWLGGR
ncbi:glutamine amidotransferase [Pseudoclavibacter terrae]|uniref:glutamine amidotransferase n=1 Tax=Pseudoclavibacter terrae TaxID=1530195 RepID=UPI00232F5BF0|nr:glutamine amidotransferase [Pseudoclavibacter terrae]